MVTRAFDTPLGPATQSTCRPARFAGMVDHLWHFAGVVLDRRERVLPNATLELTLALGDVHHLVGPRGLERIPVAAFGGLRSRPFVLDHPARCDTIGIVLRPAGAYALLARPLAEVREIVSLEARTVLGPSVDELAARCAETPAVAARFALVLDWLAGRFACAKAPDPAITWMAAEIERGGADLRVGALRQTTGLSKARVVAAFREQIGVSPKLYARLVRFRFVLEQIQLGATRMTDVALDAGYYDQAHMNAEFRALAGMTPTAFLAARHADGSGNTAREPAPTGR